MIADARPGTYLLVLAAARPADIRVGALGSFSVQPGFFIYIGSAFGPGGLKARLAHHVRRTGQPHWHIDYLRTCAEIQEIWYSPGPQRWEHTCAQLFQSAPAAHIPLPGFGSSDCRCATHLYYFENLPVFADYQLYLPGPLYREDNF